jgi:hypothetical protein
MKKLTTSELQTHADKANLEFVGPYFGALKKTKYLCKVHGEIEMRPSDIQRGSSCRLCMNFKSSESYIREAELVNLVLIGNPKDSRDITEYECKIHGRIFTKPSIIQSGHGCKQCAIDALRKSDKELEEDAIKSGVKYIGGFTKTMNLADYECSKHGLFRAKPSNIQQGMGCKHCVVESQRHSYDFVKTTIENRGFELVSTEYKTLKQKLVVNCKTHGLFNTTFGGFLYRNYGCPSCAVYGFKPDLPAEFYIYECLKEDDSFIGFGITNEPNVRKGTHKRNLTDAGYKFKKIKSVNFLVGSDAFELEKKIKKYFLGKIKNTGIIGFKTEAIDITEKDALLKFIPQ